jgi:hypothetical protein
MVAIEVQWNSVVAIEGNDLYGKPILAIEVKSCYNISQTDEKIIGCYGKTLNDKESH